MTRSADSVLVLILNWNGWQDTLECLQSLRAGSYEDAQTVVIDNGSGDGSLDRIAAWAAAQVDPVAVVRYTRGEAEAGGDDQREEAAFAGLPHHRRLILIDNGDNLGFAAGNNVGIRFALGRGSRYVLLLNNDTVVGSTAIAAMVRLLEEQPQLVGVTPRILYYDTDRVWNCGGDLTALGGRRYHWHGRRADETPQDGWRQISFITGCAALLRTDLFCHVGLLSERFFFGEEDFEFAQRLRRARLPLACCYGATIRHKVSRSLAGAAQGPQADALANRIRLHYLNRFIDMRGYYPRPLWEAWRLAYLAYVALLLTLRYRFAPRRTLPLLRSVWVESAQLQGVSRATFERVLRGEPAVAEGERP